jgi:4-amino-4-deoxy-L-arabinose transferase-like glycosyltransferase
MRPTRNGATLRSGIAIAVAIAGARLALHVALGGEYGFHRDELALLDDSRHLDWGYVAYPPLVPFIGRIALEIFGISLAGIRLFSALAQAAVVVFTAMIAREVGGSRAAQIVAALAAAISPLSVIQGVLFQYVSFDFLWWVLLAWLVLRVVRSDDPRWWVAIGATIGIAMMTRYTVAFLVAGMVAGFFLSGPRHHLRSPWLWGGAVLSLALFLPNLLWQLRHDFITLDFLSAIHERDVEIGRADGFFAEQLLIGSNVVTVPLWAAGLAFYFLMPEGKRFRIAGWMYLVPLVLFAVAQGRSYYMAPAYPMLLAGGAVVWERWVATLGPAGRKSALAATAVLVTAGALFSSAFMLPVAPVNSPLWHRTASMHDNFAEEIGWGDLVETVAGIYHSLPDGQRRTTTVLTGNYGQAGAVSLLGGSHGLPPPISGINSYWLRGWGDSPENAIVLGIGRESAEKIFETCEVAGRNANRLGVENEESRFHAEILLCRTPRAPWPVIWPHLRRFG